MTFNQRPTPEDLEQYRSFIKLIAQMQLSPRLRTKEDASDVVQRVMLAACRDINDFRGTTDNDLRNWLKRITLNVIASLGRFFSADRRKLSLEMPLDESSTILHKALIGKEADPGEVLIAKEEVDQLFDDLLHLLEDERTAVVLKHLHKWPIADIAEYIGRTEAAVGGLLVRGLAKLAARVRSKE